MPSVVTVIRDSRGELSIKLVESSNEDYPGKVSIQTNTNPANFDQFANECWEILNDPLDAPNFSISFDKFMNAYSKYYDKQLNVRSYGCSKLIDLFAKIPWLKIIKNRRGGPVIQLVHEDGY